MGCGNAAPGTTQAERRPDASGTGATRLAGALVEATAAAAPRSQTCRPGACPGTRSCHPRRSHVHDWGIDILLATREAADTGTGPAQGSIESRLPRGMISGRTTTGQPGPIAPLWHPHDSFLSIRTEVVS